jgi:hypothetical protein
VSARGGARLALAAVIAGSGIALVSLHASLLLLIGVATAVAGVLLALRGDRPLAAPRWLAIGLAATVTSVAAHAALGLYGDWQAAQRLADGAPLAIVEQSLRGLDKGRAACRSLAFFSSLALLIGAVATRTGKAADPESKRARD